MAKPSLIKQIVAYAATVPLALALLSPLQQNFRNNSSTNYVLPSSPALYEVAKNFPLRSPEIAFSSNAPPKDNLDIKDLQKNIDELNAANKVYDAKVKALDTSWAEREKRIEGERAYEKKRSLAKVKALDDLSVPTSQPAANPQSYSGTGKSTPEYGNKLYESKREAIKSVEEERPLQRISSYTSSLFEPQKIREAKLREIAKCEALNNREEEKVMEKIGIPYAGSEPEAVQDYKPGQRIRIPVQKISPAISKEPAQPQVVRATLAPEYADYNSRLNAKNQDHPLEHYADYSTGLIDPKVGSETSKGNLNNAKKAVIKAGQDIVYTFTASSDNPERKPMGWNHSANDFVSYFENGGKSIRDTVNPDSEVYNEQGIPARIIGLPTAIAGVALGIPLEVFSLVSANGSDNTLEHLVLGVPDDLAEAFAQTVNAPGNLVTKKGFGYHFRRAYSSTIRFFKNVLTGKGFWNAKNAKKAFALKGKLASLESAFDTAALGAGAAGVTFLDSGSGGFDVFNPVAPVAPGTLSGTSFGRVTGR